MYHVIGLKQTHGIKNVTLKVAKKIVGVAVYWEELYENEKFIHMQIKLIFIWMVVHQASLWWRGFDELGNRLFQLFEKFTRAN